MTEDEFVKYFEQDQAGCPYRKEVRTCSRCGQKYDGHSAISRRDNKTEICPECGMTEAMEDFMVQQEASSKRRIKEW